MYSQISFETLQQFAAVQAQQIRELISANERARLENLTWVERTLHLIGTSLTDVAIRGLGIVVGIIIIYLAIRISE